MMLAKRFLGQRWKTNFIWQLSPTVCTRAEDSVRLVLTKNSARSISCPSWQVHGISFEQFVRPWQTVAPDIGPLPLLNEMESSSGVTSSLVRLQRHVWWANTSRKRTSTARRKPPCPAWSGISLWACHEWRYCIAPKDHRNPPALPRRQRADSVGREMKHA